MKIGTKLYYLVGYDIGGTKASARYEYVIVKNIQRWGGIENLYFVQDGALKHIAKVDVNKMYFTDKVMMLEKQITFTEEWLKESIEDMALSKEEMGDFNLYDEALVNYNICKDDKDYCESYLPLLRKRLTGEKNLLKKSLTYSKIKVILKESEK